MKHFLILMMVVITQATQVWACDPNENCNRKVVGVTVSDPVCEARKLVCRTECGKINKDADMYILNSRTQIRLAYENFESIKRDIQTITAEIHEKVREIQKLTDLVFENKILQDAATTLMAQQSVVREFIQQTKLQDPTVFSSKEKIKKLIQDNSTNKPVVEYLRMFNLLLDQNSALQVIALTDSAQPFFVMQQLLEKQYQELQALITNVSERIEVDQVQIENKIKDAQNEAAKIDAAHAEIQKQEARKCSPIL